MRGQLQVVERPVGRRAVDGYGMPGSGASRHHPAIHASRVAPIDARRAGDGVVDGDRDVTRARRKMIQPRDQRERRAQPLDSRNVDGRHADGTVARVLCRLHDFDSDEIGRREDRSPQHEGGKSGKDRGPQQASDGHDGSLTEVSSPHIGASRRHEMVESPACVRGSSNPNALERWSVGAAAPTLRTFSDVSLGIAACHREAHDVQHPAGTGELRCH